MVFFSDLLGRFSEYKAVNATHIRIQICTCWCDISLLMRPCWGKIPTSNMALKKQHNERWNGHKQHEDALNTNSWQGHGLLLNTRNDSIRKSDKGNTLPPPLPSPKEGPPVRKVLVQWWGCGAAGIKSEKYFPQMVVNIAWQHMACNFKWLFFFCAGQFLSLYYLWEK